MFERQRVRSKKPEQQSRHENLEPQQSLPERRATDKPSQGEQFDRAPNSQRADMVGLSGEEGGGGDLEADCSMDACRELAAAASFETVGEPIEWGTGFGQAEALLLASGEECVDVLAKYEDASKRWYHFGMGDEAYEEARPLYLEDVKRYQALALRVRLEGGTIEATRTLVQDIVAESDATRLLLEAHGFASRKEGSASVVLDERRLGEELNTVGRLFDLTGYRYAEQDLSSQLEDSPEELLGRLEAKGNGLGFVLSCWRSRAVAIQAGEVERERDDLLQIIHRCDRMGELMQLLAGAVTLGGVAAAGRKVTTTAAPSPGDALGSAAEQATEVAGSPTSLVGIAARQVHQAELHRLAAELMALTAAQDGWDDLGLEHQIDQALAEYSDALGQIDAHDASIRDRTDQLTGSLANLGHDMDTAAIVRGQLGVGERGAGPAMEILGRIRATHRALGSVVDPIQQRMLECRVSASLFGDFAHERIEEAWLRSLRERQGGHAQHYNSVHLGLEAYLAEVQARQSELADTASVFDTMLRANRS